MRTETAKPTRLWQVWSAAGSSPLRRLHDRRLLLILALALLAGTLAYQAPPSVDIAVGWLGDQLFLPASEGQSAADAGHWYGDELTDTARSGRSRWTRQEATAILPGIRSSGDLALTLRVQGWPADVLGGARQPDVALEANGVALGQFRPTEQWADYHFTVPALAAPADQLRLVLHASQTFTSTLSYADLRPKGVRVEHISVRAADAFQAAVPPLLPLLLLALNGMLAFIALLLPVRHATLAFVLATVAVSLLSVGLALARVWTVTLLPWISLALALVLLVLNQRSWAHFLQRLIARYTQGSTLNYGLVTAAGAWLAYAVAQAGAAIPLPEANAFRESFPDSLIFGLLGMSLLVLAIGRGRAGLPRVCRALVALMGERRVAALLLGLLVGVWVGYEAWAISTLPYVGHADYADNAVVARNLVAGRGWVVDYVSQFYRLYDGVTRPQETWPLLQPVWIAPFFVFFGVSAWAAKLPNLLFTIALALLIYSAGARFWDRRVGLVAALFVLTSHLFFKLVIYTTSDLAFTVFACGAIYLLYLGAGERATPPLRRWPLLGSGVVTGLMLLQKPASGGLIAFGMGLWLLARVWPRQWRLAGKPMLGLRSLAALVRLPSVVVLWGCIALLILSPYLVRNIWQFGTPFFSTEGYDAWVLSYADWEDIYRIYTPEAGLSETGGLPEQSWILRWGFDRTLLKLRTQVAAVRDYLLPPWNNLPLDLSDLVSGRQSLLFGMGAWLALLGLIGALRVQRRLLALLLAAFGPYTVFLTVYWHADEERYFVVLMPWLALLAGYALWRAYDRIAVIGDGRWAALGLALVLAAAIAVVQPSWPKIDEKVRNEPRVLAADLDAYSWLQANTPPGTAVMTRNPWQLNWHSQRPALMIPNTADPQRFLRLARYYGVRYLVLDTLQNPSPQARRLIDQLLTDPRAGFQLVYTSPPYQSLNQRGQQQTLRAQVYRFPDDYGQVAELRP